MAKVYILLPAIFLWLMGFSFSESDNLKLGIFNGEVTQTDKCPYRDGCYFSNLSCRYLKHLRKQSITEVHYADLKSAIDAANSQKVSAALYFNENFTDAFVARIALGEDSDDETIEASKIRVWLDNNGKNANILTQLLKSAYKDFNEELLAMCKTDRILGNVEEAFSYSPLAVYDTDKTQHATENKQKEDELLQIQTLHDMKEMMKTMTQLTQQLNTTTNLLMEIVTKLTHSIH